MINSSHGVMLFAALSDGLMCVEFSIAAHKFTLKYILYWKVAADNSQPFWDTFFPFYLLTYQ